MITGSSLPQADAALADSAQTSSAHDSSDHAAARAWAAGAEHGFAEIVARYAPMVYARCRRALCAADAEDATQAVFLVLARRGDAAAATPSLAAWLMQTTDYVLRNAQRDRGRRRNAEECLAREPAFARSETPGQESTAMEFHELRAVLDAALADLPGDERLAVQLHYLAGHSLSEIADDAGLAKSTVASRVQRGLERLRVLLGRRGVACSTALLLAVLASEARACVPPILAVQLCGFPHADSAALSAPTTGSRVERWATPESRFMSRLIAAAATATAFLVLLAPPPLFTAPQDSLPLTSQAQPAAPATAAPDLSAASATTSATQAVLVFRFNRPERTVQRLLALPEAALLPDAWRGALDAVREVHEITGVVSVLGPSSSPEADEFSRIATLGTPQEREAAEQALLAKHREVARVELTAARPDAAALAWLRNPTGLPADFSPQTNEDGWTAEAGAIAGRLRIAGSRASFTTLGDLSTLDWIPAPWIAAQHPEAEAELRIVQRRIIDGQSTEEISQHLILTCGAEGFALAGGATHQDEAGRQRALNLPRLDPAALCQRVPGDALLAVGIAMKQGRIFGVEALLRDWLGGGHGEVHIGITIGNIAMVSATTPATDAPPATLAALLSSSIALLEHSDGNAAFWVQSALMLPALTLSIDVPADAVAPFLTSLDSIGAVTDTEGVRQLLVGSMLVQLAHRDGHLICTTHTGGMNAALQGAGTPGTFAAHPDIAASLADLRGRKPLACAFLRPIAFCDAALPFAMLVLPDTAEREHLRTYQQRLRSAAVPPRASLVVDTSAEGWRIDARGLLGLVMAIGVSAAATEGGANPLRLIGVN